MQKQKNKHTSDFERNNRQEKQEIAKVIDRYKTKIRLLEEFIIDIDQGHGISESTQMVVNETKNTCFVCITNKTKYEDKIKGLNKKLKKCEERYKQLEKDAGYLDPLTQVHNKKYFNLTYLKEIKKLENNPNKSLTLAFLDISDFTVSNSENIEFKGDILLKKFTSIAQEYFSTHDIKNIRLYRYEGNRFAILTKNTPEKLSILLEVICDKFSFFAGVAQYDKNTMQTPAVNIIKKALLHLKLAKIDGTSDIVHQIPTQEPEDIKIEQKRPENNFTSVKSEIIS